MSDMSRLRELRRQNLELLLASMGGHGAQKQLADKSRIHLTYINSLRVGNREMGENIARKIEAGLGLDTGWMDAPHGRQEQEEEETVETRPLGDVLMENQLLKLWQTVPVERQPLVLELLGDIAEAGRSRSQSPRNHKKQSQTQGQTQNQSHGRNQTQNQIQVGSDIPGDKRNQTQNQSHGRNQTQNQIQL